MYHLTDKIVRELNDHFDITRLLDAVKQIDQIRSILKENHQGQPPKIRDELLKLHGIVQKAMQESDHDVNLEELWNLAGNIEYFFDDLVGAANDIRSTVRDLLSFMPDPFESLQENLHKWYKNRCLVIHLVKASRLD